MSRIMRQLEAIRIQKEWDEIERNRKILEENKRLYKATYDRVREYQEITGKDK